MLAEARRLDAVELREVGHRLLEVIDPDAAEELEARRLRQEEDAAAAKTWLTTWDDRDGTTHLNVKLSTRHADMLRTVLHAIANPSLADAITRTTHRRRRRRGRHRDTERPGQRVMGEAFCRLIETLDPNRLPHSGGLSATVVVTIPLETLQGGLGRRPWTPAPASHPVRRGGWPATPASSPSSSAARARSSTTAACAGSTPSRSGWRWRSGRASAAPPKAATGPPPGATPTTSNPGAETARPTSPTASCICGRHHTLVHHPDYTVERRPGWRISITRTPRTTPRRQ